METKAIFKAKAKASESGPWAASRRTWPGLNLKIGMVQYSLGFYGESGVDAVIVL